MKDEHRKDFVVGAYQLYDKEERFQQLQEFIKDNSKRINDKWKNIILDTNWKHSDRPDWCNTQVDAGIEDTTVEDTNHFMDIHFSKRKYKHKRYLKRMTPKERKKYFLSKGVKENEVNNNEEIAMHIPSTETVHKMNEVRSVYKWMAAIDRALKKHKNLMQNLSYSNKFIYLYDVTPPYIFRNSALKDYGTVFNPEYNKKFMKLFQKYPAKIIWYLKNQDKLLVINNIDNNLNSLENFSLDSLEPSFPLYDNVLTYLTYASAFQEVTGNYKDMGTNYLP